MQLTQFLELTQDDCKYVHKYGVNETIRANKIKLRSDMHGFKMFCLLGEAEIARFEN